MSLDDFHIASYMLDVHKFVEKKYFFIFIKKEEEETFYTQWASEKNKSCSLCLNFSFVCV